MNDRITFSQAETEAVQRCKVAKWWLPEDVAFVDLIPLTATGKLYKLEPRKTFAEHFMR